MLYAALDSPNFRALHAFLYAASAGAAPRLEYVVRHVPPPGHTDANRRTHLTGYGVALDLKTTDYLALDDRRQCKYSSFYTQSCRLRADCSLIASSTDSTAHDDRKSTTSSTDPILALLAQYPPATASEAPLSEDELESLGLQAAQLVADAAPGDALHTLTRLAQNFPRYASAIARRVVVGSALAAEAARNEARAQPGVSALWLNGMVVPEGEVNAFSCVVPVLP